MGRWSREGWAKFLLSAPGIHDGLDADAEWIPRWALGKGSQGQIALFVKFNAAGAIEDQMVIKEAFGATHDQLYDYGVLREAVFHGHLTAMVSSSFIFEVTVKCRLLGRGCRVQRMGPFGCRPVPVHLS